MTVVWCGIGVVSYVIMDYALIFILVVTWGLVLLLQMVPPLHKTVARCTDGRTVGMRQHKLSYHRVQCNDLYPERYGRRESRGLHPANIDPTYVAFNTRMMANRCLIHMPLGLTHRNAVGQHISNR